MLARLPAGVAGIASLATPVLGVAFAALQLHEIPSRTDKIEAYAIDFPTKVVKSIAVPRDMDAIVAVVRAVAPKPVNVLIGPRAQNVSLAELGAVGVRRVSVGGALYKSALAHLVDAAQQLRAGDFGDVRAAITNPSIAGLF